MYPQSQCALHQGYTLSHFLIVGILYKITRPIQEGHRMLLSRNFILMDESKDEFNARTKIVKLS